MYSDRIYLTPQEILTHDFKIDARGYRPQEVDKYLDMVIRDYTEYMNIIKSKDEEITNLTEDNEKLKQEIRNLNAELQTNHSEPTRTPSNVDLLKRISQLEKIVYGHNE